MPVEIHNTPNPNAMKFTVGVPVGQAKTFNSITGDPLGDALMGVAGVASVFMTSDFVTVTKAPDGAWVEIVPEVTELLELHFA